MMLMGAIMMRIESQADRLFHDIIGGHLENGLLQQLGIGNFRA